MYCHKCGAYNEDTAKICVKCGAELLPPSSLPLGGAAPAAESGFEAVERRYPALRLIGSIYKILGVIVGAITLLIAIASCTITMGGSLGERSGPFSGFLGGLLVFVVVLIIGGIYALTLYAIGEGIYLFLSMEENTRATVMLLQQQTGQRS